jgi:hypothetical protein
MEFEVFMRVNIYIMVFWDMTLCEYHVSEENTTSLFEQNLTQVTSMGRQHLTEAVDSKPFKSRAMLHFYPKDSRSMFF